ncbi:MAG: IclR family transcriptional regulator [Actinobacteria bacterium]|nr:IclR family transcriptional regulator [Actinomycetota bacterium]
MKSLNKIFNIIDFLKINSEIGLKELSENIGINKSTTYRLLSELNKHGYVDKNNETKKYKLGIKFVEIANHIIQNFKIIDIAAPYIDKINSITKETIHLAQLVGDEVVYVDKRESLNPIRLHSQIGKTTPWHCTGVGKVILAFQHKEFQEKIINSIKFEKFTEHTITDKNQFIAELDQIKRQGYALDREEHQKNVGCIAVPILDNTNKVFASMSVTFIFNIEDLDNQLKKYKDLLLESSELISKKMGYNSKFI